jgi:RNA polymerase sigma factor (TIGR02999 family)
MSQLLKASAGGDEKARNALFDELYQELRSIARAHRSRWHGNETLNTTALIHEAYLKLAASDADSYEDRTHFFATASRAMRQVLINYAQRLSRAKRGNNPQRVTLSGHMPATEESLDDILLIEELLQQLEAKSERQCRMFECRVFGGMTIEETAEALAVSPATVKRDWSLISAWIYREVATSKVG